MRIIELTEEARTNILENLLKRSPNSYGEFEGRVNEIIENVTAMQRSLITQSVLMELTSTQRISL